MECLILYLKGIPVHPPYLCGSTNKNLESTESTFRGRGNLRGNQESTESTFLVTPESRDAKSPKYAALADHSIDVALFRRALYDDQSDTETDFKAV